MHELNHKHIIVTAHLSNPPDTAAQVDSWLIDLVAKVEMQVLFGPFSTRCDIPGNEGVTGIICLSTSHSSIHVWDKLERPFVKFDLYSCKDFSPEVVIDHLNQFGVVDYEYIILDRNNGIDIVEKKSAK